MKKSAFLAVPQHLQRPAPGVRTYGTLRFDPKEDHWIIEAEPQVLEFAKRLFPMNKARKRVVFSPGDRATESLNWLMLRWPLEIVQADLYEIARTRAVEMARRRSGATVSPLASIPYLKGNLFPYQGEDVARMVAQRRLLNANDTGSGKTVEALAALAAANAFPAVIVCEPHVQVQWTKMVDAWLAPPVSSALPGLEVRCWQRLQGRRPSPLADVPVYIIHYGLLDDWIKALLSAGIKGVVFDEVQQLRHSGTKKYIAASRLTAAATYCWGLSATPIYGYGEETWAVMHAIEPYCLGSKEAFVEQWCDPDAQRRVAKPERLGAYLREEGLLIRRGPEIKAQLPPVRRITVPLEQDDNLYRKLIAEATKLADRYEGMSFTERGQAVRQIDQQTRQAAGIAKAAAAGEFIAALVAAGERLVVGAHHHRVHELITGALPKGSFVRITGLESPIEKGRAIERFASGEVPVCMLALRAATGIDGLQKSATGVCFAELDWSPAVHKQFEGRVQRYGLLHNGDITAYYLVAGNTYDDFVQDVLGLKIGQFSGLIMDATAADQQAEVDQEGHLAQLVARLRKERR